MIMSLGLTLMRVIFGNISRFFGKGLGGKMLVFKERKEMIGFLVI